MKTVQVCVQLVTLNQEQFILKAFFFFKSSVPLIILFYFFFLKPRVIAYNYYSFIQSTNDLDPFLSSSGYSRHANHYLYVAFSGAEVDKSSFLFSLFLSPAISFREYTLLARSFFIFRAYAN